MITRHFGIPVTSPGAILRRERDLGTPLGQETAEVLGVSLRTVQKEWRKAKAWLLAELGP